LSEKRQRSAVGENAHGTASMRCQVRHTEAILQLRRRAHNTVV